MSTAAFQMIDGVPTYNLFIGGEWVPSSRNEATASYNPATGDIYARVHQAGARETEAAIDAAHGAYKDWADKIVSEREAVFLRAADVLAAKTKEIVDVLIEESGSVAGKAGFEVGYCFDLLRTAASELRRSPGETMATDDARAIRLHHPPTARRDRRDRAVQRAVPSGDEEGRACSRRRQRLRAEAFGANAGDRPEDRRSVRRGRSAKGIAQRDPRTGRRIGSAIFADPRVRMVTFTGSTQTGRHLAVEAAKSLKKFTLEMGGKSPLIVLADADVDYAVRAAAFGIFFHQGQVCMANSRVLVEEPIFDAFCERFVAVAKSLKVGDPREPDTVIGPLIRGTQCAVIDGHVEDAVGKGATVLCGAKHEKQFYWPTVLKGVTPDMRIFHEESFGPVTSIIKVKDHNEALEIANNTSYGLSSGVITNDMQKALDFAFKLDAGMVHINDCTVADEPHVPFGGVKNSGYGREGGRFSMEEMTEVKWITVQRGQRGFPI